MRTLWTIIPLLAVLSLPQVWAVSVTSEELSEASRWVGAKFLAAAEAREAQGYLMVYTKSGSVQKNEVTGGLFLGGLTRSTLRIAMKQYQRGLHCSSMGKVLVHLPSPGKGFEADVGMDSNDLDYYSNQGRGSVIASIVVRGKEAFGSNVMREGIPATPVKVDLGGATEFTLEFRDGGTETAYGTGFNQADWADAHVTLADGKTVWLDQLTVGPPRGEYSTEMPFTFRYACRPSKELLKTWQLERSERKLDENQKEITLIYTDPKTGLQVRCVAVEYKDFPTVEWTLYFKNTSERPTPILENIESLDTSLERRSEGEFLLHHSKGSPNSPTDYQPYETPLGPKAKRITLQADAPPTLTFATSTSNGPARG